MQKIIIASGPVIIENGKVLLNISGDDSFWKFCGGKVKDDEDLVETAKRRAKEEMGIDMKILEKEPFITFARKETEEGKIDIILVHFLAEKLGEIQPGQDIREWAWHDLNNLPKDLGPNIISVLKYFGFIK